MTPATGIASGTATSAVVGDYSQTWGTLTATAAGWTVDGLKRKYLRITGGGGYSTTTPTNNIYQIISNTADTISIQGIFQTGVNATTTFDFVDIGTQILADVATPRAASAISSTSTSGTAIAIQDLSGVSGFRAPVFIANIYLASSTNGISMNTVARIDFANIKTYDVMLPMLGNAGLVSVKNLMVQGSSSATRIYMSTGDVSTTNYWYDSSGWALDAYQGDVILNWALINLQGASGSSMGYSFRGLARISYSRLTAPSKAMLRFADLSISGGSGPLCFVHLSKTDISNSLVAIYAGGENVRVQAEALTGTGNTTAITAVNGAAVFLKSNCTITGTTELSVDGTAFTLAAMRAATPKYCTNATIAITGTKVRGD